MLTLNMVATEIAYQLFLVGIDIEPMMLQPTEICFFKKEKAFFKYTFSWEGRESSIDMDKEKLNMSLDDFSNKYSKKLIQPFRQQ